jgi:hypothetical protein
VKQTFEYGAPVGARGAQWFYVSSALHQPSVAFREKAFKIGQASHATAQRVISGRLTGKTRQ